MNKLLLPYYHQSFTLYPESRLFIFFHNYYSFFNLSAKGHVGCLGSVPAGVFNRLFELDQLAEAGLHYHAFFLTFVQQLLLS